MGYVISYDVGTTGIKTCLFELDHGVKYVAGTYEHYGLYILENGGAEQDEGEWWSAMCSTTKELLEKTGVDPSLVKGISFCSQMQGLVLVDKEGNAVRRAMSYMDQRAEDTMEKHSGSGIKVAGLSLTKLVKSLLVTTAAPTSVKDPLWKYKWVEEHEPEVFERVYKWLDVKEYLILRATGEFVMTKDSAYATFLYDTRDGKWEWNESLCKIYGIKKEHLPKVIDCTEIAGYVTRVAAKELGLCEGTCVIGGGGDATLIGVGAGCIKPGETHIYSGTSGWVSTVTDRQVVDVVSMIAATVGAKKGIFNYFAEMETAGKCFEWVKEHLALDEIGIYLNKQDVAECSETLYRSLYDYLSDTVKKAQPGSGGVIFTPWLHGNRCPFEDSNAAGMFFNIKLETGKTELIRAVLEGICYHLRWMLECEEKKVKTSAVIRFVGGGALSEVTCQILADITGRRIETIENSQDVGALGAAMISAVALGEIGSIDEIGKYVTVNGIYEPYPANRAVYDKGYEVFKKLYSSNKKLFGMLN